MIGTLYYYLVHWTKICTSESQIPSLRHSINKLWTNYADCIYKLYHDRYFGERGRVKRDKSWVFGVLTKWHNYCFYFLEATKLFFFLNFLVGPIKLQNGSIKLRTKMFWKQLVKNLTSESRTKRRNQLLENVIQGTTDC